MTDISKALVSTEHSLAIEATDQKVTFLDVEARVINRVAQQESIVATQLYQNVMASLIDNPSGRVGTQIDVKL